MFFSYSDVSNRGPFKIPLNDYRALIIWYIYNFRYFFAKCLRFFTIRVFAKKYHFKKLSKPCKH
ncbi:hypothetical protein DR85_1722 [Francisella tularensis]|nr:hypothetical protein DR85_1722 [Francisella tularensis]